MKKIILILVLLGLAAPVLASPGACVAEYCAQLQWCDDYWLNQIPVNLSAWVSCLQAAEAELFSCLAAYGVRLVGHVDCDDFTFELEPAYNMMPIENDETTEELSFSTMKALY